MHFSDRRLFHRRGHNQLRLNYLEMEHGLVPWLLLIIVLTTAIFLVKETLESIAFSDQLTCVDFTPSPFWRFHFHPRSLCKVIVARGCRLNNRVWSSWPIYRIVHGQLFCQLLLVWQLTEWLFQLLGYRVTYFWVCFTRTLFLCSFIVIWLHLFCLLFVGLLICCHLPLQSASKQIVIRLLLDIGRAPCCCCSLAHH